MRKTTIAMLVGAMFSIAGAAQVGAQQNRPELSIYENMDLFSDVFETIRRQYVDEVDISDLTRGAVKGMLSSLDPHSTYLDAGQMNEEMERASGEFGGLGIEVTMENGWVRVISPIDDTPAAEAGMRAGDYITAIDGELVLGLSLNEAVKKLRGPIGSDVVITVEREGEDAAFDVTITRAIIKISAAEVSMVGDVMIVRIKSFTANALESIAEGIAEQSDRAGGAENVAGIVLDLRNNPGGLLTAAVDVTDAFLDQGEIVSVRGRGDSSMERFLAEPGDLAEGRPIVVLINGGSASASEIVAGALQDHDRAVIVGTKSFGKGSVQSMVRLGERRGGIRLTTALYYTPSGRSIQAQGIQPDVNIPNLKMTEEDGVRYRSESELPNSLENDSLVAPDQEQEKIEATIVAIEEVRETDAQLAYAIDILNGLRAFSVLD